MGPSTATATWCVLRMRSPCSSSAARTRGDLSSHWVTARSASQSARASERPGQTCSRSYHLWCEGPGRQPRPVRRRVRDALPAMHGRRCCNAKPSSGQLVPDVSHAGRADCRQLQARNSTRSRRANSDERRSDTLRPTAPPPSHVLRGAILTAACPATQNPRLGRTYRGASCQFLSEECGNNLFCINGGRCVSGGCDCPSGFRWEPQGIIAQQPQSQNRMGPFMQGFGRYAEWRLLCLGPALGPSRACCASIHCHGGFVATAGVACRVFQRSRF